MLLTCTPCSLLTTVLVFLSPWALALGWTPTFLGRHLGGSRGNAGARLWSPHQVTLASHLPALSVTSLPWRWWSFCPSRCEAGTP